MLTVPPNILGLTFADRLLVDIEKRDVSLIGVFHEKGFPSFPSGALEMLVFIMVNGGRGEGIFELTVYQLDPHGDHESSDWVYRKRKQYKYPEDDPNRTLNIGFPIRSLRFPAAGEYLFAVTVDGTLIAERRIFTYRVTK
jgi:hypothetical protein